MSPNPEQNNVVPGTPLPADTHRSVPKRKFSGDSAKDKLLLILGVGFVAVAVFIVISSHRGNPHALLAAASPVETRSTAKVQKPPAAIPAVSVTPSNEATQQTPPAAAQSAKTVTPTILAGTATKVNNPAYSASEGHFDNTSTSTTGGPTVYHSIGQVPKFKGPTADSSGAWRPASYSSGAGQNGPVESGEMSEQAMRAYQKEVTAPSLIFAASANNAPSATQASTADGNAIPSAPTNFGLQPGYHIAARIESVVSTALATPVVAVVDYNYEKDGRVLIPAGARVVGQISQASSSTGIIGVKFTSIYMPDGTSIPISAAATNRSLGPIKGYVTGRQRAMKFLLGALEGIGGAAALYGDVNNSNSAITPSDELRTQLSANIGNSADSQIQQVNVNQRPVVTVPAGTPIYVVFTTPVRAVRTAQAQMHPASPQS